MTLDDFIHSGDMREILRAKLREKVLALGKGGMAAVAREMLVQTTEVSCVLSPRVRREFSWNMADRIVRAVEKVKEAA